MSTPFDGSWNGGTGIIGSQADTLTLQMPGRPSAAGVAVNVGAPVIYADFTDDAPFTGVLSADGQKILWSNTTVWTRDNGNGSAPKVADGFFGASGSNAAAVQAVQAAIAAANPQGNGVNFGPFSALVVPTSFFSPIWASERGDTPATFCQFQGFPGQAWLPLGDIVATGGAALPSGVLFFAAGSDPTAVANPVGFNSVANDGGSKNPNDLVYWAPVAPDGYTAVGLCFTNSAKTPPNPANYWCVKTTYLQFVGVSTAWSDSGQGWDDDGNLWAPSFSANPEVAPQGQMLILPSTLLSAQAGQPAFALVGQLATLDVAPFPTPDPVYVPGTTQQGDTTDFGLGNVVVVPFTAIPGDPIPNQPTQSPFYYVASEPFWLCTATLPTSAGGTQDLTKTTGVSETDAQTFQQTTSMSVSCEFGAAYGGFSAKVSASLSDTLQLGTSHSSTSSTEDTDTVHLVFPIQPITSVWQSQNLIQVFRADGTPLAAVTYADGDLRFEPSGATPATLALRAALARR